MPPQKQLAAPSKPRAKKAPATGRPQWLPAHHVPFEQLSESSRWLMRRDFEKHVPSKTIAYTITHYEHEPVSPEEVERYRKVWLETEQKYKDARDATLQLVADINQKGDDISEQLRAAFQETMRLARDSGAIKEISPLAFEAAERHRAELELKKKQTQLSERRVQVAEGRFEFDRKRAQAAIKRLDRKAKTGESLTEQEVNQIKEIYGLAK